MADRVSRSAMRFPFRDRRNQKAHLKAEVTRQTYRSSSGKAASASTNGAVSCPQICAFRSARYGFIFSERTRSSASSSPLMAEIGIASGSRFSMDPRQGRRAMDGSRDGSRTGGSATVREDRFYPACTSLCRLMESPSRRRRLRKTAVETTVRMPRATKAL